MDVTEVDRKLDLIMRVSAQTGVAAAIRATARVLARAGMQEAHALVLNKADEIMDIAEEMQK